MNREIVYAADWMKPDSRGHYLLSEYQVTIRNPEDLNETGRQKLDDVLAMVNAGQFRKTLYNARLQSEPSGFWQNDRFHPGATEDDRISGTNAILNSRSNLVAFGTFTHEYSNEQRTSTIRFMEETKDFNPTWIYTMSGSLYRVVMNVPEKDEHQYADDVEIDVLNASSNEAMANYHAEPSLKIVIDDVGCNAGPIVATEISN